MSATKSKNALPKPEVKYVYVGSKSRVGRRRFNRIGQPANLPPELIKDAILGGCPLIPKDKFDAIGFTPDELRAFGPYEKRMTAPAEFHSKLYGAGLIFDQISSALAKQ